MNQTIAEFEKNSSEVVRISLSEFKGHSYVDIRIFYEDDEGEWRPTKKGVTVSVDLVDELLEAVKKVYGVLQQKGA